MGKRLDGKVCFITGATRGIGEVASRLFAEQGAKVVLAGRGTEAGDAIAQSIRDAGGEALFVQVDVTVPESVERGIAATVAAFGRLDVIYNNAGGSSAKDGLVTETAFDVFWDTMKLELFGVWLCCRYGIPEMIKGDGGSIINSGSIMGAMGVPNRDAYTAAKGGIISLTRSMAVEYAQHKIRANVLVPGAVATDRVLRFFEAEPHLAKQKEAYLLGMSEPIDVANAALYLASDESCRMTGHMLPVDSGILIS